MTAHPSRFSCGLIAVPLLMGRFAIAAALAAGAPLTLDDDGGWCWFEDERALIVDGQLIVGTVANGRYDRERAGDIVALVCDLNTREVKRVTLHENLQADDHNSPAFLLLSNGRVLTMYAKHGPENKIYYRITQAAGNLLDWGPEQVFVPSETSRVTYSNLHYLAAENDGRGRIYDFFRGYDNSFKPSYAYSDDQGQTWIAGNVFIQVPSKFRHRPYVKYASKSPDTVHLFYTEGHPRDFDNSIYHIVYRAGTLFSSNGQPLAGLKEGLAEPAAGTLVFRGDANNVGWTQDLAVDKEGNPYGVFSVQKDSAGLPSGPAGQDHRYYFASWDGNAWQTREIAHAGSRLYAGEDDYTGGICVDPDDPDTVYMSTNVDPVSGEGLAGGHYQVFQGRSLDRGQTWKWRPLTQDSDCDNLRPIVPQWNRQQTAVLWLRGKLHKYTKYELSPTLLVFDKSADFGGPN